MSGILCEKCGDIASDFNGIYWVKGDRVICDLCHDCLEEEEQSEWKKSRKR